MGAGDVSIKTLRKYITLPVIVRILALFYSEDSRERDYLKTVLLLPTKTPGVLDQNLL